MRTKRRITADLIIDNRTAEFERKLAEIRKDCDELARKVKDLNFMSEYLYNTEIKMTAIEDSQKKNN